MNIHMKEQSLDLPDARENTKKGKEKRRRERKRERRKRESGTGASALAPGEAA